jgi:hypothetical protein
MLPVPVIMIGAARRLAALPARVSVDSDSDDVHGITFKLPNQGCRQPGLGRTEAAILTRSCEGPAPVESDLESSNTIRATVPQLRRTGRCRLQFAA